MYVFVYLGACVCMICMYVCIHVCMFVCMYFCMYVCIYVYMYVCMYAHDHTTTYAHAIPLAASAFKYSEWQC
jgi:hypothetical protein